LLRTFGEHPALAAAGYNAGPAAAGLWFAQGQQLPLEMFVAQIPFDETRTYVMRVLSNLAAYQLLDPSLGRIDISLALR
jgi:soluble lytic murein transglycosylase